MRLLKNCSQPENDECVRVYLQQYFPAPPGVVVSRYPGPDVFGVYLRVDMPTKIRASLCDHR